MTSHTNPTSPLPSGARARLMAARVLALVFALFWGVLFFGIIDLAVVMTQDERFFEHYLLEAGWGLLYTGLVMLPLLLWVAAPRAVVLLQLVVAVAVSVLLTGLAALALGQVLPAIALGLSALVPAALAGRSARPPAPRVRAVHPVLGGLVVVALAGGVAYAVAMIRAAYDGVPDDNTWGLMHLPMQAALGLALAGCAAVIATARNEGLAGWRAALVPVTLTAAGLGVISVWHPDHLGSLGTVGGAGCIAWAVAFAVSTLLVRGPRVADPTSYGPGSVSADSSGARR